MGPGTYGTKLRLSQPLKTKVITEFCTHKIYLVGIFSPSANNVGIFSPSASNISNGIISSSAINLNTGIFSSAANYQSQIRYFQLRSLLSESKFNCTANAVFCCLHQ